MLNGDFKLIYIYRAFSIFENKHYSQDSQKLAV